MVFFITILFQAQFCETCGVAHQLNITRGFFETSTDLLYNLEHSMITHSVKYIVGSGVEVIQNACDVMNLDFCRPPVDETDLPFGNDVQTVDHIFDGVPVRLFRPEVKTVSEAALQPAIVYVHGAVVMGTIGRYNQICASVKITKKHSYQKSEISTALISLVKVKCSCYVEDNL